MTEHASQEIIILSPPSKVLEVLLEIDDYPQWIPEITNVEVFERDSRGRATKAKINTQAFGKSITHIYEYSYEDYPQMISWMLESGDMVSALDGFYKFKSLDDGSTQVTYDLHLDLSSPLPGFIKKKATEKIVSSALNNLKKYCENN